MTLLTKNFFNSPSIASIILALIPLLFALFLEHILHLIPCYLCELQRTGYIIILLITILGMIYKTYKFFHVLSYLGFLGVIIIAFWHKGIESYWWSSSSRCINIDSNIGSLEEELKSSTTEKPIAMCDQISPEFLLLTLVEWSLVYAIISFLFLTYILLKYFKVKK